MKFKQGDKVRLTKDYYQYLKKGEEGTIWYATPGPIWTFRCDKPEDDGEGGQRYFEHFVNEDCLELI